MCKVSTFYVRKYHCDNVNYQSIYKYIRCSCVKFIKFRFWLQVHTSLGKSMYSQNLIVKTMYNKTELDKLRDDMREQIVDPGIKKLEALINSSVTSLSSTVAVAVSSLASTKKIVTSFNSSVASLNSARRTLTSIQSSMNREEIKLENLKRQVHGGIIWTSSNI